MTAQVHDAAIGTEIGTELIRDGEAARVWMLTLEPGEATEFHRHDYDYVFVVVRGGLVQTEYINGEVEVQDRQPLGTAEFRRRDLPHRLVNVGDTVYENVVIEIKRSP